MNPTLWRLSARLSIFLIPYRAIGWTSLSEIDFHGFPLFVDR